MAFSVIFSHKKFGVSRKITNFAVGSRKSVRKDGIKDILVIGRLRTLSSVCESRKFKDRKIRNGASALGVLYFYVTISHGVGYLKLLILVKAMREPTYGIGNK